MKPHHHERTHQSLGVILSLTLVLQMITPIIFGQNAFAAQVNTPSASPTTAAAAIDMNAAADLSQLLAASASEPPEISSPLSVSIEQSTYSAAGSMVVTYTVRNNLKPMVHPDISSATTITAQVAALTAIDFESDPNIIRSVLITTELTNAQTSLNNADPLADRSGDFAALNLGDIPPLGTATAVMTLTTPVSSGDFAVLDSGAVAYGQHQGRALSANAPPIALAPDGFDQYLVCTIDANCGDRYITQKAAELGGDPAAIFAFVQGLNYELYEGSLRGARGTLWSAAGNATDQASLLIALLRASGIPAAYRQGTLNTTSAQTVLSGMFPANPPLGGFVPAGTPTADPLNDPALIAQAQDHTWVEAYLPGSGWTAFDPTFAAATAGDTFAAPTGGQIAELDDALRHKVTLQLKAERYGAFPVGGSNIYETFPLSATFNTVELIGEPVVFAHLVESNALGGLAFSSFEHTYIPYFIVGDEEIVIEGEPMLDLLSNFPFGQDFLTAEWLILTTTDPSGNTTTYERELFDDIGYDVRTIGGVVDQLERGETPRISSISSWTTLFAPSEIPAAAVDDLVQPVLENTLAANALQEQVTAIAGLPYSPEEFALIQETLVQSGLAARAIQKMHLLKFTHVSDISHDWLAESTQVAAYPAAPRIFTVGWERNDLEAADMVTFDLGLNELRTIPYPGQTDLGSQLFLLTQGYTDMAIEAELVREIAVKPLTSVGEVFKTAGENNIPFTRINSRNLDFFETMPISNEAKARITTAVLDNPNLEVIVPTEMVTLDGAGEPTIGWLEIDHETGRTIDVMENGQHMVAAAYGFLTSEGKDWGSLVGAFAGGVFSYGVGFAAGALQASPNSDPAAIKASAYQAAADNAQEAQDATDGIGDDDARELGFGLSIAMMEALLRYNDPPVPEAILNLPPAALPDNSQAITTIAGSNVLNGSTVAATVDTAMVAQTGATTTSYDAAAVNHFIFNALAGDGALYQNAVLLDSGPFVAEGSSAVLSTDGSPIPVGGSQSGPAAFYGSALTPLAQGTDFDSYTLALTPAASVTLDLKNAEVAINGTTYTGDFELVTSTPLNISGSGAAAAANFATDADLTTASSGLMIANASGSLSVGSDTPAIANGFALGSASGSGTITPNGAADTFTFNGTADFFAVALTNPTSVTPANSATAFDADVITNYSDSYTLTVTAPTGWTVSVDGSGGVSALPAPGTAAGSYKILVTAQSQADHTLFAAAEHTVTVTAVDGVAIDVVSDPLLTVPWGEEATGEYTYLVNDGRLQLPGAAYTVWMTNTSSIERTFDVSVSGLPTGWAIFGAQHGNTAVQLTLPAGSSTQLGLYVKPTGATLPPISSSYPFDVIATAADNGAVNASDSAAFTVPAVPFPFVTVDPEFINTSANTEVPFDVTITNVGNAAGSFDLISSTFMADWLVSGLTSPIALNPGESSTQTVTATVTTGEIGRGHSVSIGAVAPTLPYTPTSATFVYVMGPKSGPVITTARELNNACLVDSGQMGDAAEALALAMAELEQWCAIGDCPLPLRDDVAAAASLLASSARLTSLDFTGADDLDTAATTLAAATNNVDIDAALDDIVAAVSTLEGQVCEFAEHRLDLSLTPFNNAILGGETADFSLELTNLGTVDTTYAVTVTLPDGDQTLNPTIPAGDTFATVLNTTPADFGLYTVQATATAVSPDVNFDVAAIKYARLNVVDRYIQLTRVFATPDFVETGVSSTTVSIEVANIANVPRSATAQTTIEGPNGALLYDQDMPLSILAGSPREYALDTVDTSGWASGLYTMTVDLVDGADNLIPDGSNYGFLTVGEGLLATAAVSPELTAPGNVTVTTILTTEIKAVQINSLADEPPPPLNEPIAQIENETASIVEFDMADWIPVTPVQSFESAEEESPSDEIELDTAVEAADAPFDVQALAATTIGGFTRYENDDPAFIYTGTWTLQTRGQASANTTQYAAGGGRSASLTFSGEWAAVGFSGQNDSGEVEIFLDGISQGVYDLYSNEIEPRVFYFSGLSSGPHTLLIDVPGTSNPISLASRVRLDFIDTWDGTALTDETIETDGIRFLASGSWGPRTDLAGASGGSYLYTGVANSSAWVPFTGDSFSLDMISRSNGDKVKVFVDGSFITYLDQYNPTTITETVSFDGFGPGIHLLQLTHFRGWASFDTFTQPGSAPFFTPEPIGDYHRYEESDPAISYDGVTFNTAARQWDYIAGNQASDSYVARSNTAGAAISATVSGEWIHLGFVTNRSSGQAEVSIDGISQGIIDLYTVENDTAGFVYDGLTNGPHTVVITVLGTNNGRAVNSYVHFDYIDVWNGISLPDESVEAQDASRVYHSGVGAAATGGSGTTNGDYWQISNLNTQNAGLWFPFTGDSVTFTTRNYNQTDEIRIFVDGQYVATLDLFSFSDSIGTYSFDGFGGGAHILQLKRYRGFLTVDTIGQPGSAPFYTPPVQTGIIRTEEDDIALRYNGLPLTNTVESWVRYNASLNEASNGQVARTNNISDTVEFNFDGTWLGVGFATDRFGGFVEIAIDGTPVQTVDLYTRYDNTASYYFDSLTAGSHTVTLTNLGAAHPNSSGTRMSVDFFDTWDGSTLADGLFEEDSGRWFLSGDLGLGSNPAASGGSFLIDGLGNESTIWFPFTGDSASMLTYADFSGRALDVRVDGQPLAEVSRFAQDPISYTYSFDGFGPGPHVMEIRPHRTGFSLAVDAFAQVAVSPIYTETTPTGIIRYEEDNPALLFNGSDSFAQMPQSWNATGNSGQYSGGGYVQTSTSGNTVSLTFDGTWVGVGLMGRTNSGSAEIFIDGISQGVITTTTASSNKAVAAYFDGLSAGSHTITIEAQGNIYVDFFDVWDGTELTDGWHDADLFDTNGRYWLSNNWILSEGNIYAFDDDYLVYNLVNSNPRMWFNFTGEAFSFLYTERDGAEIEVFIDGVSQGIYDLSTQGPSNTVQPATIHFSGLTDGPHVVHIDTLNTRIRLDAFEADPADFAPYTPDFEWYDLDPGNVYTTTGYDGSGLLSTVAVGDINNDGIVEIVSPSNNGQVYVYRGDGVDTGGGTPELWRFTGLFSEPALGDLDGDGLAEIVLLGEPGLYVLEDTGATKWFTDTNKYRSYDGSATGGFAWGAPAIGNVDNDPEPEIVIATASTPGGIGATLAVFDADGSLVWEQGGLTRFPSAPALADLGGDGILDIISLDDETATVYDIANNVVLWSHTFTDTITANAGDQLFGAAAVANLDAKQPGGDPEPEVIINYEEWIYAFNHDGTVHWKYGTGEPANFRPSHVTISDVDGDGELEVITAQANSAGFIVFNHTLFVLEADGTLKWKTLVRDESASASGVATHDLDGDGVWEVIWNGSKDGLLILNGPDGDPLFNEPFTGSGTIIDYPVVADVDGDDHAEIVLGGFNGIFVVGFDERWGPARPLWNSHDYHITNINNDWSVPANEPPGWQVHNTYRTQTILTNPTPIYQVGVTYTHGINGVSVEPLTASRPVTVTPPLVTFDYEQPYFQPVITTTFDSAVANLQPGEVREVSSGTEIAYTLPSGSNLVTLPPLFVSAPHIASLQPAGQAAAAGTTITFTVSMTNPVSTADTYSLTVSGLPGGWDTLPGTLLLPGNGSETAELVVTIPAEADQTPYPFVVTVTNGGGAAEQLAGEVTVTGGVKLAITSPAETTAAIGNGINYTATVTNEETVGRTYDLLISSSATVSGLPTSVVLNGGETVDLPFTAAPTAAGPQPFLLSATAQENGTTASDAASVSGEGSVAVDLTIAPATAYAGPGSTAVLTPTLTNLGDTIDTYDLSLELPAGWLGEVQINGIGITTHTLKTAPLNSADLKLLVSPDLSATPGTYPITLTAASQLQPAISVTAGAEIVVLDRGVNIEILSGTTSSAANGSASWQVRVTNTGSAADTYDLSMSGIIAGAASFSTNPLSLAAGADQIVTVSASGYGFALPGSYPLSFTAVSRGDDRIEDEASTNLTITPHLDVEVAIYPPTQTITDTTTATFMLVVTNTGSTTAEFDLSTTSLELVGAPEASQTSIPPHMTALVEVVLEAPGVGVFTFDGLADTPGADDSASGELTVVESVNLAPAADAGLPATVEEGTPLQFAGSASDPNNDPLTYSWTFGDGAAAGGSLTPVHAYPDNGTYTVTLVVSDSRGLDDLDTTVVTVTNADPIVDAGADQTVAPGESVDFTGSFTDPGAADTHTIGWTFGDGGSDSGSLTPQHVFQDEGIYEVTLAVTDDDGGIGQDTVEITVDDGIEEIYLPMIVRPCTTTTFPVNVMLALDTSGSMALETAVGGQIRIDAALDAAQTFVRLLDYSKDKGGIVTFDSAGNLVSPLTTSQGSLEAALASLPVGGETRMDLGLQFSQVELSGPNRSPGSKGVIILLTDGVPNGTTEAEVLNQAAQAKAAGITIFTIGLGTGVNTALMEQIASSPDNYFPAPNGNELEAIYRSIAEEISCGP